MHFTSMYTNMKKSKINKELQKMFDLIPTTFDKSRAWAWVDGKDYVIPATRLYEIAKEQKVRKSKFHFNSMSFQQNMEWDIIWIVRHMLRVENADISIPIIVWEKWSIYDWFHRVIKAIIEWKTWIWCYRIMIESKERKEDTTQPLPTDRILW